jgi:tetratricopeptide (TPR) repeat protein
MPVRLHLSYVSELDDLIALEYGRVDEGQPRPWWRLVGTQIAYLHDGGDGPAVGFRVLEVSALDLDDPAVAEVWAPPVFDAPMIGLTGASAGSIILAARTLFDGTASIGNTYFRLATDERNPEEALDLWLCCLQAGEPVAHYGLGVTLFRLERYQEAYRHLRYYAEIAPALNWSQYWYARAAEALGHEGEARAAYRRVVELDDPWKPETDAQERVAGLERRRGRRRLKRRARGRS